METVLERLAALRALMGEKGITAYLVPTDDFHGSEYVGEYFKCRKYLTGFTGSAGTALVTQDFAGLWTDGRYFLQAERELAGSGFTLMKMREPGVPTLEEYLEEALPAGSVLGFDGRCVSAGAFEGFQKKLGKKGCEIRPDLDLVGDIWKGRPSLPAEPVWELDVKWCGRSRGEKLADLRQQMEKAGAQVHLLTSLDDIAWLLNLRGGDIPCNPVFLSYLAVEEDGVVLFANEKDFSAQVLEALRGDKVSLAPYDAFYSYAAGLTEGTKVLLCKGQVNAALWGCLGKGVEVVDEENPTKLWKACKNQTEQENMKRAHVLDGAAVTRFLHWLKESIGKEAITEVSAAEKLYTFRQMNGDFLGNSFEPIAAYEAHAANPHYSATPESDVPLLPKGLVLFDTGGQYYEGTTDITRTMALGPITQEERRYFTAVLAGHLRLANARFKKGSSGVTLDILARQPLWDMGADYNHGTGHGVGYLLNVHEGPQRINFQAAKGQSPAELCEGMVVSDEPGYYRGGAFGIRHENLVMVVKDLEGEDGTFYRFENLTMVPFDLDALDLAQMEEKDIEMLNAYHEKVREALNPLFTPEEREWLAQITRPVHKEA